MTTNTNPAPLGVSLKDALSTFMHSAGGAHAAWMESLTPEQMLKFGGLLEAGGNLGAEVVFERTAGPHARLFIEAPNGERHSLSVLQMDVGRVPEIH